LTEFYYNIGSDFTFLCKDRKFIVNKRNNSASLRGISKLNHYKSTDTFFTSIILYYIYLFIRNLRS